MNANVWENVIKWTKIYSTAIQICNMLSQWKYEELTSLIMTVELFVITCNNNAKHAILLLCLGYKFQ